MYPRVLLDRVKCCIRQLWMYMGLRRPLGKGDIFYSQDKHGMAFCFVLFLLESGQKSRGGTMADTCDSGYFGGRTELRQED